MFNDNEWQELSELLTTYQQIKEGSRGYLEIEEYEMVIDYFLQNNQNNEAIQACNIANTYHPFSADVLLIKAEILYESQKYGQALLTLEQVQQLDEQNIAALLLKSDILVEQDKQNEAIQLLNHRVGKSDVADDITILHEIVDIYDELTDFDKVYDTLVRILKIDARNEEALHKICFWSDLTKNHENSVTLHTSIIESDPFNALAWYNLGSAHHTLKNHEAAIEAYQYCIAIDDKQEATYRNLADVYMRIKNFDKAIEALEENLKIAKPEDVIYDAIGQCFERKRNYQKARHYYKEAIKLNPADDLIFSKIGGTYFREKNYEQALKSYAIAYKLNDNNPNYAYAVGNCLVELDSEKESIVYFLNAISIKNNFKKAWISLCTSLYHLELHQEVLSQIKIAEDNCGLRADFEMIKAASLLCVGKSKEALIAIEHGMDLAPSKFKILQSLQPDILKRKSVADIYALYKRK